MIFAILFYSITPLFYLYYVKLPKYYCIYVFLLKCFNCMKIEKSVWTILHNKDEQKKYNWTT